MVALFRTRRALGWVGLGWVGVDKNSDLGRATDGRHLGHCIMALRRTSCGSRPPFTTLRERDINCQRESFFGFMTQFVTVTTVTLKLVMSKNEKSPSWFTKQE